MCETSVLGPSFLDSLVDVGAHEPALPRNHPFRYVHDGYWSSTTSLYEPDWAWALYLDKGGVGVGRKRGPHFHVWAVRDGRGGVTVPSFPLAPAL